MYRNSFFKISSKKKLPINGLKISTFIINYHKININSFTQDNGQNTENNQW